MIITYDSQKTQFDLYFARDIADVLNHVMTQISPAQRATAEQIITAIAAMFRLEVQ